MSKSIYSWEQAMSTMPPKYVPLVGEVHYFVDKRDPDYKCVLKMWTGDAWVDHTDPRWHEVRAQMGSFRGAIPPPPHDHLLKRETTNISQEEHERMRVETEAERRERIWKALKSAV